MTMAGQHHTQDAKRRMGGSRRGKKQTPDAIEKNRIGHIGIKPSDETRAKMSATHREKYSDPDYKEYRRRALLGHLVSDETKIKLRESNIGKPRTSEAKSKMQDSANKRWTNPNERSLASKNQIDFLKAHPDHIVFLQTVGKGKKHTVEARRKMGERSKGPSNPRWNGGITPLRKQIHECFEAALWRQQVFSRDGYRDVFTGMRSTTDNPIEAHHILPFADILKAYNIKTIQEAKECAILWDVSNGITLRKSMHEEYHRMMRRHRA